MENIEDIKNLKIYTYEMESWHNYDSNTEKKYLRIIIRETPDFWSDDYEDYFKEHFNEIKGKTAQEFKQWIEEKREDEDEIAEELMDLLELEMEQLNDSFFDEETEEEKEREELYKDDEEFGLANSQPFMENIYFYSIDEVKKDIIKHFPYTKSSTLFEEIN